MQATFNPDRILDAILETFVEYDNWLTLRQLANRPTGDPSNEQLIAGIVDRHSRVLVITDGCSASSAQASSRMLLRLRLVNSYPSIRCNIPINYAHNPPSRQNFPQIFLSSDCKHGLHQDPTTPPLFWTRSGEADSLCRDLCRNCPIPAGVKRVRAVSLAYK